MKLNCKIAGIGSYFPDKIITNDELEVSTTNEWIQDKLGIQQRHIVDNELSSSVISFVPINNILCGIITPLT